MKKIYIILSILLLFSCNPIKRIQNHPKLYKKMVEIMVRRGECTNDTVTKTKVDTFTVDRVTTVHDSIITKLPADCNIDTVINGAHLSIKNGRVDFHISTSTKDVVRVVTNDNYIRDTRLENILQADSKRKSDSLSNLQLTIRQQALTIKEKDHKITILKFKLWGLLALIVVVVAGASFLKLRGKLPI